MKTYKVMVYDKNTHAINSMVVEANNESDAREMALDTIHVGFEVMGIREKLPVKFARETRFSLSGARKRMLNTNHRRVERGLEPIYDNPGSRSCGCEDYPCCGH